MEKQSNARKAQFRVIRGGKDGSPILLPPSPDIVIQTSRYAIYETIKEVDTQKSLSPNIAALLAGDYSYYLSCYLDGNLRQAQIDRQYDKVEWLETARNFTESALYDAESGIYFETRKLLLDNGNAYLQRYFLQEEDNAKANVEYAYQLLHLRDYLPLLESPYIKPRPPWRDHRFQ